MKNKRLKAISFILSAIILMLSLVAPASALDYKKGTNSVSAAYRESEYYERLTSLSLTGDGRTDLLAVALSQLGYTEGNENGAFGGKENGTNNFTEYNFNMGSFGSGYGGIDYPWCASFVSFCLLQAETHNQTKISDWCRKNEGNAKYIWREVSCNRWAKQLRTCGYFRDSVHFGGSYLPIPGDLIFFTEDGKLESHIGIVLYCDGKRVYTVEGNTSSATGLESNGGGVYQKSYPLASTYIRGYGVLPYKVNNKISRIDYSGANPTAGAYVSTVEKGVYPTEDATTYTHLIPKHTVFEVSEVSESGKLKVRAELGGNVVEGYIKNDSDRVIQLSSNEISAAFENISAVWGYKSSSISSYTLADASFATKPAGESLALSQSISVSGTASFTRKTEKFGYYFDGKRDSIVWDSDAIVSGGTTDVGYKIVASTDSLTAGKHTVSFVICLADGTIAEIDSLEFTAKKGGLDAPDAPKLWGFTESSVKLSQYEGFEYKIEGGEWQSSSVFENLSVSGTEPYLFYQRLAETELNMPSKASEPLSIDLAAVCDSIKLQSLTVEGVSFNEEFSPDLNVYTARVPFSVSSPDKVMPIVSVRDGSSAKIELPSTLEAGQDNEIKITVASPYGSRVYTLSIFREEEVLTAPPVTDSDSVDDSVLADPESSEAPGADIPSVDDILERNGCESTLSCTALALVALVGSCMAFVRKK